MFFLLYNYQYRINGDCMMKKYFFMLVLFFISLNKIYADEIIQGD